MKRRISFLVVDSADDKRQLYKISAFMAVYLGCYRHSSLRVTALEMLMVCYSKAGNNFRLDRTITTFKIVNNRVGR